MLLEDRGNDRSVWCAVAGGGSQLFVEVVPAAGRVHDDDLARRIGQVQEGVRDLGRQVCEAALIELEDLLADPDLEAPAQDMDRLLLLVVDVQRGPAVRRDFDGEVVEGATGVLAGDLEDEVSPRARLQPQAVVGGEDCIQRWWSSLRISSVDVRVASDRVFAMRKQYTRVFADVK